MAYDRPNRNAFALAAGTGAMRKAAEAAGLPTYAVPLCGAGFTGHFRSTKNGKCISCGPMRQAIAKAERAALKSINKTHESNTP